MVIGFASFARFQYWAVLVRKGIITSDRSIENPTGVFSHDLTATYLPNGACTEELIGRGWWCKWNPIEDELTPGFAECTTLGSISILPMMNI